MRLTSLAFLVLLLAYAGYGQFFVFTAHLSQGITSETALAIIVYFLYLIFLGVLVAQIDLWHQDGSRTWWHVVVEKVVFVYLLLLWRHHYNVVALFDDMMLPIIASLLAVLWVVKSSEIAADFASILHRTNRTGSPQLVPGATSGQRQFNCAVGIFVLLTIPILLRDVPLIFGTPAQ